MLKVVQYCFRPGLNYSVNPYKTGKDKKIMEKAV